MDPDILMYYLVTRCMEFDKRNFDFRLKNLNEITMRVTKVLISINL